MISSTPLLDEAELTSRLRRMADDGASVGDLVCDLQRVFTGPDVSFAVVLHLRRAFHLTVGEARSIEGSTLLGGTVYTPEQTEALIRPWIDRNRELWRG